MKIEINEILGTNKTRIVLEEGDKRASFDIATNCVIYALPLIEMATYEVAKDLLANIGEIHIETPIDRI